MYDTIIIGAGMSGLAAGIRLAHFGRRVCILERHTAVGGLNSFYRINGRNYDVGLHAVTNYVPKGTRRSPLARLLRQLRLTWDEFALAPQLGSAIVFPDAALHFNNDFDLFRSEVRRRFPGQRDNLERLLNELIEYEQLGQPGSDRSAREAVSRVITDPLLVEMIFCPMLFYGGPRQRDMDFGQFSVLFRSIFLEGLARPFAGIRLILNKLVRKYEELGGELKLRSGVARFGMKDGRIRSVILDNGDELNARHVLSSAGWRETMRLCDEPSVLRKYPPGEVSFVESISILDVPPRKLGYDRTIVFFNDSSIFHYGKPADLTDLRSGVVTSPNNYVYDRPLQEGILRITALANYDRWADLDEPDYRREKVRWYGRMAASAVRFVPDFRNSVIDTDMFTPTTIRRFTGHENGAIYGAPVKRYDGTTHLENLFVCGTDQGLVGIVGSIISGITIANRYLLK